MTDDVENRPDLNTCAEWEEPRAIPEVGLADLWRLPKDRREKVRYRCFGSGKLRSFGADGTEL
jgi:hypothetical protein